MNRVLSICYLMMAMALPLLSAQPVEVETYYTPFDAVIVSLTDAKIVAAAENPGIDTTYIRYLDLRTVPRVKRMKLKKALDMLLNSLNTKYRRIIQTVALPTNSDDPIILRVNLNDFGLDPKAWDDLAEKGSGAVPIPDPFFHTFIEELIVEEDEYEEQQVIKTGWYTNQAGQQVYGQYYSSEKTKPKPKTKKKKKILAAAPWLAHLDKGLAISELTTLTQTKNPILNGNWFLVYASWAPAYYEFIGIKGKVVDVNGVKKILKGEKEFEIITGVDEIRAKRSQVAAIADSKIVTLHNRILIRFPTVIGYTGGYYWSSFDTAKGIDDEDYMNTLAEFDKPKIAAKEIIATALNTLQIYAVTDDQENLLLLANPEVAQHGDAMPTKLQDKQVYVGLRNCALCHNEGIITIADKVRALARDKVGLFIYDKLDEKQKKDKSLARKLEDAFFPNLDDLVKFDNSIHTAAIFACNGLTPVANRDNLESLMRDYYDSYISIEIAALESGWPPDKLEAVLKKGVNLDYTLTSIIPADHNVVKPSRLPWERQGVTALMTYLMPYEKQRR